MKRLFWTTPLIYVLITTFASCNSKIHHTSGAVWGTTYNITYDGPRDMSDSIIAVLDAIDSHLSMFNQSSTVSRLNRGETDSVSLMFAEVFTLSARISRLSGGAFDPTVGPLTDLWGFGPKGATGSDSLMPPSHAAIDSVLAAVGIDSCHIEGDKIFRKHPLTTFDFSSIAKGYGVDAVAAMLERNGASNILVEIGGEIVAIGNNPQGRPWRVQIDAPSSGPDSHISMLVIPLTDAAVATSGNYRNYRLTAAGRIGHTLNPHTGYPVATTTASATVIAPDCATADALATACMVMPLDSALAMIDAFPSVEALIAVASADTFAIHATAGFPTR